MNDKSSKSSLFLMELIMSILFFSLAAVICLILFIKSHTLSKSSVELNHSVVLCESIAEQFYGNNGVINDGIMYFDKQFVECNSKDDAWYMLTYTVNYHNNDVNLLECDITMENIKDNTVIYSLSPVYYPNKDN